MKAPPEFRAFAKCFFGDSLELANNDVDVWIARAIDRFNTEKRPIVKKYLETLIKSGTSDQELQRIWNKSGAGYYIVHAHQMRGFLTLLCEKLGCPPLAIGSEPRHKRNERSY